jgi:hypothetical protein
LIYEKISGKIGVEMPEFLEWNEKKYIPFIRRTGGKLIGFWTTMIGEIGKFIEIWGYENFAAMDGASKKFHNPDTEEDRKTYRELSTYHKDKKIEILRGTSLSPTRDVMEG